MTTIERISAPISFADGLSKGWERVPLGEVLTPVSRPVSVVAGDTYALLGMHWYAQGLYVKDRKPGASIQASTLYQVHEGDFVYNRLFAWKGSFGIADATVAGCYVSNEFPCFRVVTSRAEPQYLRWYFSQAWLWQAVEGQSSGSTPTSRLRLKEPQLLALDIPVPPIDEQRHIVARIEALAARIAEARELRREAMAQAETLLDAARAGVFQPALERSSSHLRMVAMLERGRFSHRPRNDPMFFGGAHPWIQIGEIEASGKYIRHWTDTLNDVGLAVSRKFPKGTLLISIAATIGAVGILDFACCVPDSIVGVTPTAESDGVFLYHYLGYLRRHLEQVAPQSAQKNINLEILASLPVPVLSAKEQTRIAAYLDDVEEQANELTQHQEEAAEAIDVLLPAVLDRAFRGEL